MHRILLRKHSGCDFLEVWICWDWVGNHSHVEEKKTIWATVCGNTAHMLEWGWRQEAEPNVSGMPGLQSYISFYFTILSCLILFFYSLNMGSRRIFDHLYIGPLNWYIFSLQPAIYHCSQPLSGFYTHCIDDELLLEVISQTNPESQFMYVVDTRPKVSMYQWPL